MLKNTIFIIGSFVAFLGIDTVALAQGYSDEKKIEITPFLGYTLSGGVEVNSTDVGNGVIVNRIGPKSGFNYGFGFDFLASEHLGLGFQFAEQRSKLESKGSEKIEWTDMKVRNYHGILTYNMGDEDEAMRPFLFGGLGATQYSPSPIQENPVDSSTRFSTTWGGGVKVFPSENVGLRLSGRWTPTYIRSTEGGVWCSPWWPWSCWVLANPHYSHQFEMSAGVVLRF